MIEWNVSREVFSIGPITLRWYSLMFMLAFLAGYYLTRKFFRQEGKPESDVEDLFLFTFIATVFGARLGHVLFYSPGFYFSNPIEILKVWEGGLASHGAAIGIPIALYLYSRKRPDQPFLWVIDRVVIVVALAGFFIRLGNLFNSEIVGSPTEMPWGFKFPLYEQMNNTQYAMNPVARHPAQLYEAIAYLLIFIFLYKIYQSKKERTERGLLLGIFFVGIFGFRFFVEFLKEFQEAWEATIPLKMGQWLSIPFVLLGIWLIYRAKKNGEPEVQVAKPAGEHSASPRKRKKR